MCVSGSPYGDKGEPRNSDGQINRLSAGQRREGEKERASERARWFKGPTMPSFTGLVHTAALLNSVAPGERGSEREHEREQRVRHGGGGGGESERVECYLYYPGESV